MDCGTIDVTVMKPRAGVGWTAIATDDEGNWAKADNSGRGYATDKAAKRAVLRRLRMSASQ